MNDLERRLRAALSAATEQAPDGLLAAITRRHRRRRRRVGAGLLAVAAVAAVAVTPVANALRGGSPGRTTHASRGSTGPSRSLAPAKPARVAAVAAKGTVLSGCDAANPGDVGSGWQAELHTRAGPLWFLDGGHSRGSLRLYVAIVVLDKVPAGSVVVARVAPAGRQYLRFLYGPADTLSPGTSYTMRSGESGVSFVACPGQGPMPAQRVTDYYGGFLVKGARCVPVQVLVPGRVRPLLIGLGACAGH